MRPTNVFLCLCGVAFAAAVRASDSSTSPEMFANMAAGLPKFDPTPQAPKSDAIMLPKVVVHSSSLPSAAKALEQEERTEELLERNLGSRDGLDRGVLNRFTIAELWKRIPFLNVIPFVGTVCSMSNEQRAEALEPR
jgi:hypothetical protein